MSSPSPPYPLFSSLPPLLPINTPLFTSLVLSFPILTLPYSSCAILLPPYPSVISPYLYPFPYNLYLPINTPLLTHHPLSLTLLSNHSTEHFSPFLLHCSLQYSLNRRSFAPLYPVSLVFAYPLLFSQHPPSFLLPVYPSFIRSLLFLNGYILTNVVLSFLQELFRHPRVKVCIIWKPVIPI